MAALVKHVSKKPLRMACESVQLDQGASSRTQVFGTIMPLHMELNPNHIVVKVDFRNANSRIERRGIALEFENGPLPAFMLRYKGPSSNPSPMSDSVANQGHLFLNQLVVKYGPIGTKYPNPGSS